MAPKKATAAEPQRRETMSNIDFCKMVRAAIHHSRDEDQGEVYCVQIELGNDYAITLTVSENDPPSVNVWEGDSSRSFLRSDISEFREFVAAAFEPRPK
jgi:hypothetical protein